MTDAWKDAPRIGTMARDLIGQNSKIYGPFLMEKGGEPLLHLVESAILHGIKTAAHPQYRYLVESECRKFGEKVIFTAQ